MRASAPVAASASRSSASCAATRQAATTQRYAHLDADPLRRASDAIGSRIAAALDGKHGELVPLQKKRGGAF
jgi:hypothetical protein